MKKLLKYLLPVIVAAAFAGGADSGLRMDAGEDIAGEYICGDAGLTSISSAESELCLPRQVSVANTLPVQGSAQRTGTSQRNSLEFAKSGKVINAGIRYFIQKVIILARSQQAEPCYILVRLGKFLI